MKCDRLVMVALLVASPYSPAINKCIEPEKNVTYTDKPCPRSTTAASKGPEAAANERQSPKTSQNSITEQCHVIVPSPHTQEIWSPYAGECKQGLANGKGTVGILVKVPVSGTVSASGEMPVKTYRNIVHGQFKDGVLNGPFKAEIGGGGLAQGTYKMNVIDGLYRLDTPTHAVNITYRDGKLMDGIQQEKIAGRITRAIKTEQGKIEAICSEHARHEKNCTDQMRSSLGITLDKSSLTNQTNPLPPR